MTDRRIWTADEAGQGMADQLSDLRLPATIPGLVRCESPVIVVWPDGAISHGVVLMPYDGGLWITLRPQGGEQPPQVIWTGGYLPAARPTVYLDLTSETGRDHAARYLARTCSGSSDILAAWVAPSAVNSFAPFVFRLHVATLSHPAGRTWTLPSPTDHLNPVDLRCLPDGSRWVDAEALRVACTAYGVP